MPCVARKAGVLKAALTGPVTTALPASLLQLLPNCTVFLDHAAAAELDVPSLAARPGWSIQVVG